MRLFFAFAVLALCVGCIPQDSSTTTNKITISMNKRVAASNSGCQVATMVALDTVALANYDATKAKTIEVAIALLKFVDTGAVGDLPLSNVSVEMKKFLATKNLADYGFVVDSAMSAISLMSVDTNLVGPNNVILIRQGLLGVIAGAELSKKEWRSDVMPVARSLVR